MFLQFFFFYCTGPGQTGHTLLNGSLSRSGLTYVGSPGLGGPRSTGLPYCPLVLLMLILLERLVLLFLLILVQLDIRVRLVFMLLVLVLSSGPTGPVLLFLLIFILLVLVMSSGPSDAGPAGPTGPTGPLQPALTK